MSGEQMEMVQNWIGDAVARNLRPLCRAAYAGVGLLICGTAALVATYLKLEAGVKTADETQATIKTEVRPVLTNHETRLVVLEWAGGIGHFQPPATPNKGGTGK